MTDEEREFVWSAVWKKTDSVWLLHNPYGHVFGYVKPTDHASFYAYSGMELTGDYIDEDSAKAAVDHARKDIHQKPYPNAW